MPKKSIIVTDHAEFLRAKKGSELRYFPAGGQTAREEAIAFDEGGDFTPVFGFAAYDATVSTSYAVALYATKAEAEAHEPTPAPKAPTDVFAGAADGPKTSKPR